MRKATARRNVHLGHPGGFTACGKAPGNFVFRPNYATTPPEWRCRRCEADLASRRAYAAFRELAAKRPFEPTGGDLFG